MEYLNFDLLLPRFIFVALGWIIYSIIILRKQKNVVDEMNTKTARKNAWATYWRKHWEDYPIALVFAVILSIVINVGIIAYDAIKGTNYNETLLNTAGVDLAISFILGAYSTYLIDKWYTKGKDKI